MELRMRMPEHFSAESRLRRRDSRRRRFVPWAAMEQMSRLSVRVVLLALLGIPAQHQNRRKGSEFLFRAFALHNSKRLQEHGPFHGFPNSRPQIRPTQSPTHLQDHGSLTEVRIALNRHH